MILQEDKQMGKITDVIKKEPDQITFVGFEKLNDVITIKPANVTLIISPRCFTF